MNLLVFLGLVILATAFLGGWGFIGAVLVCVGLLFLD